MHIQHFELYLDEENSVLYTANTFTVTHCNLHVTLKINMLILVDFHSS